MRYALIASLLLASPAAAQGYDNLPGVTPQSKIEKMLEDAPATGLQEEPQAKPLPAPKPAFELADDLDGLFAQLKRTSNERRAERISKRIWAKWQTTDNATIDLLTVWARDASAKRRYSAALDLLDQVVVLEPDYAEGYNQRATLHYVMKNFDKSIADIERTLALEPRHYGALAGLASILQQLDRKKAALETWYRALAVYPQMQSAQKAVLMLEEDLAGEGI